jgi:HSP90 family molecular chaperone
MIGYDPATIMSSSWQRRIPFRVDVAGIIEIMGTSLYSRSNTPIRELIQNAHDSITRRRQEDLSYKGRIDIVQDAASSTIKFRDDGIGLSEAEADQYLGTLGVGITGLIKRQIAPRSADAQSLIGQFGVGLFSAFMLADKIVVETRKSDGSPAVRWEAGAGTDILLSSSDRQDFGAEVTLFLKPAFANFASDAKILEEAIREYADFLLVPIHCNGNPVRVNQGNPAWLDPSPDTEQLTMELQNYCDETPLDVIPVRCSGPAAMIGALYVSPARTPGFSGEALVTITVRRMVISRAIRGLLPPWANFLRGVLELSHCSPTASREDLVRDEVFNQVKEILEEFLFAHLERLLGEDRDRPNSIVTWHRYTFAGAAIQNRRLRALLARCYTFPTSRGAMTFEKIAAASRADSVFESDADHVIWFNAERRQERHIDSLFAAHDVPCVHTLRSFEEALLAAMVSDFNSADHRAEMRAASPGSREFARSILGLSDLETADDEWQKFLTDEAAGVYIATFAKDQPAIAFINERRELMLSFDELKKNGTVPKAFQKLIDKHFDQNRPPQNEVLLNRSHPMVAAALSQKTSHPLASMLRVLVANALASAGAAQNEESRKRVAHDLDWISEVLMVRKA